LTLLKTESVESFDPAEDRSVKSIGLFPENDFSPAPAGFALFDKLRAGSAKAEVRQISLAAKRLARNPCPTRRRASTRLKPRPEQCRRDGFIVVLAASVQAGHEESY
jgi:hypothetical protein